MELRDLLPAISLAPAAAMALAMLPSRNGPGWSRFHALSLAALAASLASLAHFTLAAVIAVLVQLLGLVIGAFSRRYLEGEPGQRRYVASLAGVLASVHVLLLADHWLVLIAAWSLIGILLQRLLCFYEDRPFARLAAHKKRLADLAADALLLVAAAFAWGEVGSGSLADLSTHIAREGASAPLQWSAACLVLAVILRTALLPVHGWLIQVMEAPTPVSALLHAGVVNLGGFVLIRFAPLLEAAPAARGLLVAFGLLTAILAGFVMLTRISIKVRLAWSTVAQMGFMVLECGLGLYTLAALHLVGHSLYKAHAFLSASEAVRETRLRMMRGAGSAWAPSLVVAPALTFAIVTAIQAALPAGAWAWWWSGILALAWAPLLWLSAESGSLQARAWRGLAGVALVGVLAAIASLVHALPLGIHDTPDSTLGGLALTGMAAMYLGLVALQLRPGSLATWRRWSYAGFYVDELYTRAALRLWPGRWARDARRSDLSVIPTRSSAWT